jgi:hypothetical protein
MEPLIPNSIQNAVDASGLTLNEYLKTLSAADRADVEDQIRVYSELRPEQIARQNKNNFINSTIAGPLPEVAMPVLSTGAAVEPSQDPLLTHPTFITIAQSQNKTPQEYLDSLSPIMLENSRKILLGVEPQPQTQPDAQPPVLQTAVDPASRAGEEPGVLTRNEQNLVQENIGERQLLEKRIANLEGSVDTQADVARLQQMKKRLVELGGSVESNQSTPQYDAAAEAYLKQLRGQQEQAAAVAPDVRAAEAELASTTGLLSSGTLPPEMMASVQARRAAAEAALVSGNAARDARVADVTGGTLSVENPVNGNVASSYGPILQPNPNEQPGADPAMYTSVPALTPNPSAVGSADPYAPPYAPSAGGVLPTANNEPIPMGQSPVDFAAMEAQNSTSPVLINTTTPAPTNTTAAQTPALSTTSSTTATRTPVLSRGAGNMTANARGSALGMIPRGESLIRIGGAMYSGALKGDGLGAATREYGSIQDANRAAEVAAAKQAEATRIAELRARGTGSKAAGKEAAKNAASLQAVNDAMYGMQRGLDAIAESRASGGNLTGIGGVFKGIFDNFTGDPDANRRMILSRLRVDDALLRVAETKGAISNAEMKLFLSPAPTNLQDEQVWVDWLNERMAALQRVQNRLSGGEELPAGQRSNEFNTSSGTYTPSADVQAVLDKYN